MAAHSSTLAWEIPWTEEPGGLQSTGSQGVRPGLVTKPPARLPLPPDGCVTVGELFNLSEPHFPL